jgi:hypothetical protein
MEPQYQSRYADSQQGVTGRITGEEKFRGIGSWIQDGVSRAAESLQTPIHFRKATCQSYVPIGEQCDYSLGHLPSGGFSDQMLGLQHLAYLNAMSACGNIANSFSSVSTGPARSSRSDTLSFSPASSFGESLESQRDYSDLPCYNQYASPSKRSSSSAGFANPIPIIGGYYNTNSGSGRELTTSYSSPIKQTAPLYQAGLGMSRSASFSAGTPPMSTSFRNEQQLLLPSRSSYSISNDRSEQVCLHGGSTTLNPSLLGVSHNNLMSDDILEEGELNLRHAGRNPALPIVSFEELSEDLVEDRIPLKTPPPLEVS